MATNLCIDIHVLCIIVVTSTAPSKALDSGQLNNDIDLGHFTDVVTDFSFLRSDTGVLFHRVCSVGCRFWDRVQVC